MGDLYEQDFIGWTETQARLLRQAAEGRPNVTLDWDHLAEEIEDLGRSQASALASQVRRVVLHLFKLQHSPATAPRAKWRQSVRDGRSEIASRLDNDPGLGSRLPAIIAAETPRALRDAAASLQDHGEDTAPLLALGTRGAGYTHEQILGDWLPDPPGR